MKHSYVLLSYPLLLTKFLELTSEVYSYWKLACPKLRVLLRMMMMILGYLNSELYCFWLHPVPIHLCFRPVHLYLRPARLCLQPARLCLRFERLSHLCFRRTELLAFLCLGLLQLVFVPYLNLLFPCLCLDLFWVAAIQDMSQGVRD